MAQECQALRVTKGQSVRGCTAVGMSLPQSCSLLGCAGAVDGLEVCLAGILVPAPDVRQHYSIHS